MAHDKVKQGKTSWEALEKAGKANPRQVKEGSWFEEKPTGGSKKKSFGMNGPARVIGDITYLFKERKST
jgi:hypothetical protein